MMLEIDEICDIKKASEDERQSQTITTTTLITLKNSCPF